MRRDVQLRQIRPDKRLPREPRVSDEIQKTKRPVMKPEQGREPVQEPVREQVKESGREPVREASKPVVKSPVRIQHVKKKFKKAIPERSLEANKWDFGHVLIIAGSQRMAGAAILTARAALRMGSGLVSLAIPQSLNNLFKVAVPEALTLPLPQTNEATLAKEAASLVHLEKYNAIAIGPGLSRNYNTLSFARRVIEIANKPLVIDGDGLYALNHNLHFLDRKSVPIVLTPHKMEMARLVNKRVEEVVANREQIAVDFAAQHNVICLIKGNNTVVAAPDGSVYVNTTGNAGMATAGTGDVLTGMIVSLLGQKMQPFDAVCLAVYLHGLAGDLAKKDKTETCLIASDLIQYLPLAVKSII